jgi:hypothetical protein
MARWADRVSGFDFPNFDLFSGAVWYFCGLVVLVGFFQKKSPLKLIF